MLYISLKHNKREWSWEVGTIVKAKGNKGPQLEHWEKKTEGMESILAWKEMGSSGKSTVTKALHLNELGKSVEPMFDMLAVIYYSSSDWVNE